MFSISAAFAFANQTFDYDLIRRDPCSAQEFAERTRQSSITFYNWCSVTVVTSSNLQCTIGSEAQTRQYTLDHRVSTQSKHTELTRR